MEEVSKHGDSRSRETEHDFSTFVTKEEYEMVLLPLYNLERYKPRLIIEFELVIPFYLPIDVNNIITIKSEKGNLSFKFNKISIDHSSEYLGNMKTSMLNKHKTKVLMIAAVDLEHETYLKDCQRYKNDYFIQLLSVLNKIVLSYMITMNDDDCHYLTKEMLPAFLLAKETNIESWESSSFLFVLHMNLPIEKELVSKAEMYEITSFYSVITSNSNPFVIGEQLTYMAKKSFRQGYYMESINYVQTSVETLIRTLFEELLIVEGKSDFEINKQLEDTAFMHIIKRHLSHKLGGNWDVNKRNTPIGEWYENTYQIRNKAIHKGYIPTFQEADEALNCALDFKKFIVERIKKNTKKFRKLNEYFK